MNTLALLVAVALPASAQVRSVPASVSAAPAMPAVSATRTAGPSFGPGVGLMPAASPLVRLIIEPAPSPDSHGWMSPAHSEAVTAALAAVPGARLIQAGGPSALIDDRVFVEADAASAAELTRRLEAAGLRTASMDEVVALMNVRGGVPASDEELKAAAALFENGDVRQRAEAFGRVAAAAESGAAFSPEARQKAAGVLYSGAATVIELFNAIRGDQKIAIRKTMEPVPWTDADRMVASERAIAARLDAPELKSQVEPIRSLTARAVLAIQTLSPEYWVSYVNDLLPQSGYAADEALMKSPERLESFISGWISHLESSVVETVALAETPGRRGVSHGSGVGNGRVLGQRESVAYYPEGTRRPFLPQDERHYGWSLLGMSDSAAAAWTGRFVELLRAADAAVVPVEAAEHRKQMKESSDQFDREYANDPSLADHLAAAKARYMAQEEEKYQKYSRIEGFEAVDRALAFISFRPYDRLAPGFDESRYVSAVSGVLTAALSGVDGAATLKVVIDAAIGFGSGVSRWAGSDLTPAARTAAAELDRAARATAARLGLELRPDDKN